MTETEDKIEELLDELSALRNDDELTDRQQGMVLSAERTMATLYEQMRNARFLNEWHDHD